MSKRKRRVSAAEKETVVNDSVYSAGSVSHKTEEKEKPVEESRPQLIFCIAAYNAEKTLAKTLESIKPYADKIVVVDGRFLGREGSEPGSTDATLSIAEGFGCQIIKSAELPQYRQRDCYLVGKTGDMYFIVDSDEVLQGSFDKEALLNGVYDCYAIWVKGDYPGCGGLTNRIYRHIEGPNGEKPRHSEGQILIDGLGRLMDGSHPGHSMMDSFWLWHSKG